MDRVDFVRAERVEQASRLLREGPAAPLMAGGTDLLVLKKNRLISPRSIVYLKSIPGLNRIREGAGGGLVIGALASLHELARHPLIQRQYPALARAADSVASPQVRHKATLGGNLCLNSRCWFFNRSPFWRAEYPECRKAAGGEKCYVLTGSRRGCFALQSGDTAGPLIALEAKLRLISHTGERLIAAEDFFLGDGIRYLALEPGEVLTEILLPPPAAGTAFLKFRPQNNLDFAVFTLTVRPAGDGGGSRIVAGSVASRPLRARRAEGLLDQGAAPEEVALQAAQELPLLSFVRGPVDFKRQVIRAKLAEILSHGAMRES